MEMTEKMKKQAIPFIDARLPSEISFRRDEDILMEEEQINSDEDVFDDDIGEEEAMGPWNSISMNKDQKKALRKPWRQSLIIMLAERNIDYQALLQRIQAKWNPSRDGNWAE